MNIDEAKDKIGKAVVYRPATGEIETGVIASVSKEYVFVRYGQSRTAAATRPEDLRLASTFATINTSPPCVVVAGQLIPLPEVPPVEMCKDCGRPVDECRAAILARIREVMGKVRAAIQERAAPDHTAPCPFCEGQIGCKDGVYSMHTTPECKTFHEHESAESFTETALKSSFEALRAGLEKKVS